MNQKKMKNYPDRLLKELPSIQKIVSHASLQSRDIKFEYLKLLVQKAVDKYRRDILAGKVTAGLPRDIISEKIIEEVNNKITKLSSPVLQRVINGTGIILHTNLGRAPLAPVALEHLNNVAENYCNLEINLSSGMRGDRTAIVEEILCLVTGAEAALVVNNNAAAIFLVLNSLCRRREVPVSRGELVEIGGSFRMPEVMKASGAKMVEIGATNKTHLKDYSQAISARTGAILKVHTSNYKILGFAQTVALDELVKVAHENELPLIYDMGSGVIEGLENWGYPHEPIARDYIKDGVDVITFSGDKVLGGPQSGIIIGRKKYLQKIRKNHLLRALRCDKITYTLLDATLRLYLNPGTLPLTLPVAQMLNVTMNDLKKRAEFVLEKVRNLPLNVEIVEAYSQMGSGSLPLEKIPSVALQFLPQNMSVSTFARKLRLNKPVILGYIEQDAFYLNLRTVRQDELLFITDSLAKIFAQPKP